MKFITVGLTTTWELTAWELTCLSSFISPCGFKKAFFCNEEEREKRPGSIARGNMDPAKFEFHINNE